MTKRQSRDSNSGWTPVQPFPLPVPASWHLVILGVSDRVGPHYSQNHKGLWEVCSPCGAPMWSSGGRGGGTRRLRGLSLIRGWVWIPASSTVAAAAKSLQSCPTLCDPRDSSPPGSPIPGILQARTGEWVAISFSNAWKWQVKVKSLSSVRLLATPWTAAYQAPPSMGFSRQEYWSRVPSPSTWLQILLLLASCLNSQCWQLQM